MPQFFEAKKAKTVRAGTIFVPVSFFVPAKMRNKRRSAVLFGGKFSSERKKLHLDKIAIIDSLTD